MSLVVDGWIDKLCVTQVKAGHCWHQSGNAAPSVCLFLGWLQPGSTPNTHPYLAQLLALRQLLERVPLVALGAGVQSRRGHSPQS